jgi:ribose transport system permease protein
MAKTQLPENRTPTPAQSRETRAPAGTVTTRTRLAKTLSVKNIGAVYVWVLIVILFSFISPHAFPTVDTGKSILNQYAITGMVALSLVVPLSAGLYDLSIGSVVGFSGVLIAWVLMHTSLGPVPAGVVVLLACVLIGLVNAFIVSVLQVSSFIATLGSGAILTAITAALSGNQILTGRVGESYTKLATTNLGGVQIQVLYLLVIMVAIGYWLERTQSGRQMYATGFDNETARLTGAPIDRIVTLSFITSAVVSGFAGMVLAAQVAAGSPDSGTSYLIPAFSAAFLGATQLRHGRFNPWGTVIGVLLLGTGNVALLVAGGPTWTPDLFEGLILIAAVALTSLDREVLRNRFRQLRRRPTSATRSDTSSSRPA